MTLQITAVLAALALASAAQTAPLRIEANVTPQAAGPAPLNGRLLVVVSRDGSKEPRMQVDESYTSQQLYGADVHGAAGRPMAIDEKADGFPLAHLRDLPAGDYTVQAVFNRYETFRRADGRVLELAADRGEGQRWNLKPGNPMSAPVKLHLSPEGGVVRITLDRTVPALDPIPADTPYLKHLHVKNARLSAFWGRDVFLDAWVLLPQGWAEHPNARYPLVLYQDHFEERFHAGGPWRETPPTADLKGKDLALAKIGHAAFQAWTSAAMPRVILVAVNHANPFYDDSYAVNSANIGPYGDAINKDMIPEIERRYRGIGAGWARALYGGSTGGWETLATQIFYPDDWNGAYGGCPDAVDFHAYQGANLYDDQNAYTRSGPFGTIQTVSDRKADGFVTATMGSVNQFERATASHGRSAEQYDAWQAVFSPVGPDGYPAAVYDKATGVIDKTVVAYWREHWDLAAGLADARPEAAGQAARLGGRRRHLLPEQRRPSARRAAAGDAEPALRRHLPLRPAQAALLHRLDLRRGKGGRRRGQCARAAADDRPHARHRADGSGRHELALLRGSSSQTSPARGKLGGSPIRPLAR